MRPIKKQLVTVEFLDHYQTNGEDIRVIKCDVPAYLIGEDEDAYYFASWVCDDEVDNSNTEIYGLVKHDKLNIYTYNQKSKRKLKKPKRTNVD